MENTFEKNESVKGENCIEHRRESLFKTTNNKGFSVCSFHCDPCVSTGQEFLQSVNFEIALNVFAVNAFGDKRTSCSCVHETF